MASFTYNDFRVVLKRAGFEKLRGLAETKMFDCNGLLPKSIPAMLRHDKIRTLYGHRRVDA